MFIESMTARIDQIAVPPVLSKDAVVDSASNLVKSDEFQVRAQSNAVPSPQASLDPREPNFYNMVDPFDDQYEQVPAHLESSTDPRVVANIRKQQAQLFKLRHMFVNATAELSDVRVKFHRGKCLIS